MDLIGWRTQKGTHVHFPRGEKQPKVYLKGSSQDYSSSGFHNHGFLVGKSPFSEMGLWNPFQMAQKWFINGGDPNQDPLQIRMNLALSPESQEVETLDF